MSVVVAPTREHILREIRRLAGENDGAPVGKQRFETATGIKETSWRGRYWARYSDAVREAGYEPNSWNTKALTDDDLLALLSRLTRELGHFPTTAEIRLVKRADAAVPTPEVFSNRFGNRAAQVARLLDFVDSRPDYADVAALCAPALRARQTREADKPSDDRPVTGVVYLIRMGDHFKVGRSNDIDRRTRELRTQLPVKEELVHTIETDDPSGIEAYWHRRFATSRANGEWFGLKPSDVDAFRRRSYM